MTERMLLVLNAAQASDAISILDRALVDVEQGLVSDDAGKDFAGWSPTFPAQG